MLFRKKMQKSCLLCFHAKVASENEIHCAKRGVRSGEKPCFQFKYDPCKRIPPRPKAPDFDAYNQDDFSL
jgi:hypothetical protein